MLTSATFVTWTTRFAVSDLADPVLVGLAMVETFTGVRLTVADLAGLSSGPSYRARSLVYPD